MPSLLQDSKSAQLDGHIRIDSRPSGTPVLQWLSAILRVGSETDGRRYQATPGSWRSEGACLQRFPERCGIGVAISEEIVGLDRVGVARAVSGAIAVLEDKEVVFADLLRGELELFGAADELRKELDVLAKGRVVDVSRLRTLRDIDDEKGDDVERDDGPRRPGDALRIRGVGEGETNGLTPAQWAYD